MKTIHNAVIGLAIALVVNGCDVPQPSNGDQAYLKKKPVSSMVAGESGYMVSWSICTEINGSKWVNPNFDIALGLDGPLGTLRNRVTRVPGGVIVEHFPHHDFTPEDEPAVAKCSHDLLVVRELP